MTVSKRESNAKPFSPSTDFDAPHTLDALRRGDEQAFVALYERFYDCMVRIARAYVRNDESARDAVQDAWFGIVRGIARFEGRSALKTWIFSIVVNQARTRAKRDGRMVSFDEAGLGGDTASLTESWFVEAPDHRAGKWAIPLRTWERDPERSTLDTELAEQLLLAIDGLPPVQQLVLTLRDVEGLSTGEVTELLEISPNSLRVQLHRARLRMRQLIADYLAVKAERP